MTTKSNVHHLNAKLNCVRCGERSLVGDRFCIECRNKASIRYEPPKFNYSDNQQQFIVAREVRDIAQDLLTDRHRYLLEAEVRFEFVFLKNPVLKNGKEIWGQAAKVSGLNAWFADTERGGDDTVPESFFVLKFPWEVWRKLDIAQKVALVDHELCHCTLSDKRKPALRGHDCEEFVSVVARHGLWAEDVRRMLQAAKEADENPLFSSATAAATDSNAEDFTGESEGAFQQRSANQ